MIHPARSMVESLHAKGACPRLQVDLTCEGVECPDFVREKWQEQLVIDLDPSYPLDLTFTDVGIEADLSFGGFVSRCIFPYSSIYMVADRETGKGIVIDENVPESVRRKQQPKPDSQRDTDARAGGKRERGSRRRKRPRPEPQLEAVPGPQLGAVPDVEAATTDALSDAAALGEGTKDAEQVEQTKEAEQSKESKESEEVEEAEEAEEVKQTKAAKEDSEQEAQRRRSVFRVIDGDG